MNFYCVMIIKNITTYLCNKILYKFTVPCTCSSSSSGGNSNEAAIQLLGVTEFKRYLNFIEKLFCC